MTYDLSKSYEMFERAERVIPAGVYGTRSPRFAAFGDFPPFIRSAQGCRITDLDGNDRVFNCIVDMGAYEAVTALPPPEIPGDFDSDCDVDSDDLQAFIDCASGPAVPWAPVCQEKDLDRDNDVDLSDFGIFQRCISGEGNPADPNCAD